MKNKQPSLTLINKLHSLKKKILACVGWNLLLAFFAITQQLVFQKL